MSAPPPVTVKVPELKPALPAMAGEPMSASLQPGGSPVGGLTVRLTVVALDGLPLASVPVMVSVEGPAEVELVVQVIVEEPEPPLIEAGLKLHATPAGSPLALRLTVSLKLLNGDTTTE